MRVAGPETTDAMERGGADARLPARERERAAHIRGRLAAVAETGSSGRWTVRGPVYRGTYSQVYRASMEDGRGDLAVKICLVPETDRASADAARDQTAVAIRARDAMGTDGAFSVPETFRWLADEGMVVSEWIEGASATTCLLDRRVSWPEKIDAVGRCGAWLRRFHDSRRLDAGPIDLDRMLGQVDGMIEAVPARRRPAVLRAAVAALHDRSATLRDLALPRSWTHGDFKADNLLLAGDRTYGLDLNALYDNVVLLDICQFVTHLDLLAHSPRGWRLFRRRGALIAAFLEGYGGDPDLLPRRALAWFRLQVAVRQWLARLSAEDRSPSARYLSGCYRQLARDGLRETPPGDA